MMPRDDISSRPEPTKLTPDQLRLSFATQQRNGALDVQLDLMVEIKIRDAVIDERDKQIAESKQQIATLCADLDVKTRRIVELEAAITALSSSSAPSSASSSAPSSPVLVGER